MLDTDTYWTDLELRLIELLEPSKAMARFATKLYPV